MEEERGRHHVEAAVRERQRVHVRRPRRRSRAAPPQVQRLEVEAHDRARAREPRRDPGGHVAGAAADVEQRRLRRRLEAGAHGAPAGCSRLPSQRFTKRRSARLRQRLVVGHALVEQLRVRGTARSGRLARQRELQQRELRAEAGPEGAQHAALAGRGGRCVRRISSSTNSTVTELMLPCSDSTASVGARSPAAEAEPLAHHLDDAPAAGMEDPARRRPRARGRAVRGSLDHGRSTSRRTNGARPRSSTICRPWLRRRKPMRCVVPRKNTLSVSATRHAAPRAAAGWSGADQHHRRPAVAEDRGRHDVRGRAVPALEGQARELDRQHAAPRGRDARSGSRSPAPGPRRRPRSRSR